MELATINLIYLHFVHSYIQSIQIFYIENSCDFISTNVFMHTLKG